MTNKQCYMQIIQQNIQRFSYLAIIFDCLAVFTTTILIVFGSINDKFYIINLIFLFLFWNLDAFYLHKEHLFRDIYKHATTISENENEKKSSIIILHKFNIPINDITTNKSLLFIFLSAKNTLFYCTLFLITIIAMIF